MDAPTFKQLRYFAALVETRHFGRAAERCHVTQPALSMQVRELETLLGVPLVERTPGGIFLTVEGEEVARRAHDILLAVRDLTELARRRGRVLTGRFKVGVIPSIGPYLLPQLLPRLHAAYPNLELSLRESQTAHLVEDLLAGRLDLLLLALPVERDDIETVALFDDVFTFAVHPDHPLAGRAIVQQKELLTERLLLLEEGHCLRDQALALCQSVTGGDVDDFRASSLATVVQMVINGYGCTVLPEIALAVEVGERSDIRIVPFAPPVPARTVGLAWRASSPRKPDFTAFGRFVRDLVAGQEAPAADPALVTEA
jgi:LysR family transcriptional regulator, hydrogen peroxide-inducible genes activator